MSAMKDAIRVLKKNLKDEITWQYEGQVLRREPNAVMLEAFFNRSDMPFMDVVFKENDRFVETFYTDHWYNIFEIYDRDDGKRKGWYCNVCRPAVLTDGAVSYVDLALDLWISADGKQTVLDEDEFDVLPLNDSEREKALNALMELQRLFKGKQQPPI
jgi:protein associated with RNAse G/E